jgi:hypothetical protein
VKVQLTDGHVTLRPDGVDLSARILSYRMALREVEEAIEDCGGCMERHFARMESLERAKKALEPLAKREQGEP